MRNELDIQTLQKAKANAVAFYDQGDESQDFWEQVIEDLDEEIKDIKDEQSARREGLAITACVVLILLTIWLTGCSKVCGGIGMICEGVGDGVSATGQFIQETSKEK